MFCGQCGNKLENGQMFCVRCGHKVNNVGPEATNQTVVESSAVRPPEQARQETSPTATDVIWILQATRKYSMFKMVPCSIIFKNDRVILAHLTPEMQKAENSRLSKDIKAEGIGFFKGSAAMMRYWAEYYKRYYSMSEASIVSEDSSNGVIYYSEISEFKFKCLNEIIGDVDTPDRTSGGTVEITVSGAEKIKFSHTVHHSKAVKNTLSNIFGPRLKYKT